MVKENTFLKEIEEKFNAVCCPCSQHHASFSALSLLPHQLDNNSLHPSQHSAFTTDGPDNLPSIQASFTTNAPPTFQPAAVISCHIVSAASVF